MIYGTGTRYSQNFEKPQPCTARDVMSGVLLYKVLYNEFCIIAPFYALWYDSPPEDEAKVSVWGWQSLGAPGNTVSTLLMLIGGMRSYECHSTYKQMTIPESCGGHMPPCLIADEAVKAQ